MSVPVQAERVATLELRGLHHVYRTPEGEHTAIDDVTLQVHEHELVSVVGPSGCGKTTLLRIVGGLMRPTGGEVLVDGRAIDGVPAAMATVFQDYSRSLFPWMRVRKNVAFPLSRQRLSRGERDARVEQSLVAVGLDGFGERYPWQLSGGMQQRVAIARALAYRPRILLMDEPFASVDAQTRTDLEDLVLRVRNEYDMTVLFVTHDIDESVYVADRVAILSRSPSRVVEEVEISLSYPRDQIATREDEDFVALRAEVARRIRAGA